MEEEKIHQILETLYLSPSKPSSLGGIDRLFREVKKQIPDLRRNRVKEFLQTQFACTQHTGKEKVQKKKSESG